MTATPISAALGLAERGLRVFPWSRVEMPTPANDTGKPVASDDKEVHHDR